MPVSRPRRPKAWRRRWRTPSRKIWRPSGTCQAGGDLKDLESALRPEVQALRAEFKADLRDLEQRMTIRLGAMLAGAIVLAGAMVRLL